MSRFKLSIIIPTLNEENSIVKVLNPLQYVRQLGHEIIIVDANSSDRTIEFAQVLADKIVYSEKGRAIQQNRGAKVASGNHLLFLHADTYLPAQFINEVQSCYHSKDKCWGRFDVSLSGSHKAFRVVECMMNLRSRITSIATGDQAIFVHKKCFNQVGHFKKLQLMEDIELSSRLKKISKPYCSRLKVMTSSRRWEKNGIIKTIVSMWWFRLQFFFGVDSSILVKKYYKPK
jgi:rSAM/selenodomain-associated transferase 2